MILSMTGFGEAIYEDDDLKLSVSLKSLNSKNLDLRIKGNLLSDETEMMLRKKISKEIVRGKVECSVNIEFKKEVSKYSIDKDAFLKYYKELSSIGEEIKLPFDKYDVFGVITHLPQTIKSEESSDEEYVDLINENLNVAINNLKSFRQQEGQATAKLLKNYIEKIKELLSLVPDYEQERIENVKKRIYHAFENAKLNIDEERFEAELIFYLEKYDIQEEKNRLANHLEYFLDTMEKEENCGKKLGFISQEIGREINTLGSKANHNEIQKLVVQMKDELEKIKEQVLNIL